MSTFRNVLLAITMTTIYVLTTWMCTRIIVLADYAQMLDAIELVKTSLAEGGILATVIFFLRKGRAEATANKARELIEHALDRKQPKPEEAP